MNGPARPRPRETGIIVGSLPTGPKNSITDIPGVLVGHTTLSFENEAGVARTGVTAIWPADGDIVRRPVIAGSFVLNGFGEITGKATIDEWGLACTPILLTSTVNVGVVYHAVQQYMCQRDPEMGRQELVIPIVGECDDSFLNDSRAFHVKPEHVWEALDKASDAPIEEGCVGAGTGMQCFQFKGGIGSSSRQLPAGAGGYIVGVLAHTNFGARPLLSINGVPVGQHIPDLMPEGKAASYWGKRGEGGSCIVVVGTNAPLTNHQVARLAKRSALGLARTGSVAANASGELMMAFTTANRFDVGGPRTHPMEVLNDRYIDPVYQAVVEATEEAVYNALFAATTTVGRDGHVMYELPIERTLELLHQHNRPSAG